MELDCALGGKAGEGGVRNSVFEAVETFPRWRPANTARRPTRWKGQSPCYATVFVNRSA
jgi:hypothetical protein